MTTVLSPRHRLPRFHRLRNRLKGPPVQGKQKELPRWLPWAIGVVVLAALGVGYLVTTTSSTAQTDKKVAVDQRDATAQQATTLADQVAAACAAGGATAADLQRVGACQQAAQVQSTPVPQPGPKGDTGPGPTADQINAAVASWLFKNPPPAGRAPTVAEIAAAVTDYMIANPAQPGRAPTAAEISNAVAGWFADHPVRDGVDGHDGKDGPGPTEAQIQAAVDQYVAEHPPPAGPAGPAGPSCPAGTTLKAVTFAGGDTGLGCVTDPPATPAPTPLIGN